MERTVTVLAAQVRPIAFDPEATFEKFEREVTTAAEAWPQVDLMVFPELYLTGDEPFTGLEPQGFIDEIAEPVPGPITERIGKVAQRVRRSIVAGSIFERDDGRIFNTALAFSRQGELVATHRKLFPWRPWEKVSRGRSAKSFELEGIGRIGLMICYDGWFPEVSRFLAMQGAELLIQPSLTSTSDREQELVLARAHAIFNQCYVINVNSALGIGGGHSIAADPEGRVLFQGSSGEELILEILDLERVSTIRKRGTRGLNRLHEDLLEARAALPDLLGSSGEV
jgi:formamidase